MENLPGIKKIFTVFAGDLPDDLMQRYECGLPVGLMCPVNEITFVGDPEFKIKATALHNSHYEKGELTFSVCDKQEFVRGTLFVLQDVTDQMWLMGCKEEPYPVVEYTDSLGLPGTPRKIEYVITYIGGCALMPIS